MRAVKNSLIKINLCSPNLVYTNLMEVVYSKQPTLPLDILKEFGWVKHTEKVNVPSQVFLYHWSLLMRQTFG